MSLVMFQPGRGDMRVDYPELTNYPEFADLSSNELKFVWYFANKTSEFSGITPQRVKVNRCIDEVYQGSMPHDLRKRMLAGNFPKHIEEAVKIMERFSPSIRSEAKMYTEQVYKNLQLIGSATREEIAEMDWDEKKKYTDLSLKIITELPQVIDKFEHGFGMGKKKSASKSKSSVSFMDQAHDLSDD